MSHQQIVNTEGALGYDSTAGKGGNQRAGVTVRRFRNMSTAAGIGVGAPVKLSTLIGEGNEAVAAGSSGSIGNEIILGIAATSCSTNTNTTNRSTSHPSNAWAEVVTYGPAQATLTSGVEKGDHVVAIGTSATSHVLGVHNFTTATGFGYVVGVALTSGTSGTTNASRVFVNPQLVFVTSVST